VSKAGGPKKNGVITLFEAAGSRLGPRPKHGGSSSWFSIEKLSLGPGWRARVHSRTVREKMLQQPTTFRCGPKTTLTADDLRLTDLREQSRALLVAHAGRQLLPHVPGGERTDQVSASELGTLGTAGGSHVATARDERSAYHEQ